MFFERKFYISVILFSVLLCGCTNRHKIKMLGRENAEIGVSMAGNEQLPVSVRDSLLEQAPEDRIAVVDIQGKVLIMDAVKDEESGEMVISDRLQAVVVEAKFRNVPERNGYVDIAFDVTVPQAMQNSDWQVRLSPRLYLLSDTLKLEKLYITGEKYRAAQLKGYELYNRFLKSIIPDTCNFIDTYTNRRLLDVFIERNFTSLAALKNDTSFVDTAMVESLFGVTERDAVEHYTKQFLVKRNNRKIANKDKMYNKYVKIPLETDGIRLDSVIASVDGTLKYHYVHSLRTRKGLRKVDMVIDGKIYRESEAVYSIPQTEPLTYYISSMSFFTDNNVRYIKKIIERNAVANTAAYIDFRPGDSALCDTLHENRSELGRIRANVETLLSDRDYVIDSLVITASCSPEGSYSFNINLAADRANSIKNYFENHIRSYSDSVKSSFWSIDLTGTSEAESNENLQNIDFNGLVKTCSIAEHWSKLQNLIRSDSNISNLESVERCFAVSDLDEREKALSKTPDYKYIRSVLYPLLRTVKFDFYLHRKGMIKDTVHTTEIDTLYMKGVEALANRDYEAAVTLLRSYNDMNSAVAYICMDYNNSALEVLQGLPKSAKRDYMLAVVNSRLGFERQAAEYFLHSVEQDYAMRHRGNLDPEISSLIKKYNMGALLDEL